MALEFLFVAKNPEPTMVRHCAPNNQYLLYFIEYCDKTSCALLHVNIPNKM
ncbi:hypothetical protein WN55_09654 [Dufourea novaeangliae]|uniref:Uncharacterized protein n=1 Tax=Dufourea novaeangliae TaxID=178035 RepID=A0A154NYV4_DUFNO|nr:hypothetical protein WN55_09654 [Dufourea novaeangliae]